MITCFSILMMVALLASGTPAFAESMGDVVVLGTDESLVLGEGEVLGPQDNADEEGVDSPKSDQTPEGGDPANPTDPTDPADPGGPEDPVQKTNIADTSITFTNQVFTGQEMPAVVDVAFGEESLQEGVDFELSYLGEHTNAGQVDVLITGIGDRFEGEVQAAFAILPKPVMPALSLSASSFVYDGTTKTPLVTVLDGTVELTEGVDYDVVLSAGRKVVGTYDATVTLKGNYEGSATKSFQITKRPITSAKITGIANKVYTGELQVQKPVVVVGANTLKLNRDYTLSYKANRNVGSATINIKGTGNYSGSLQKTFKITARSIATAKVTGIVGKTYTGKALRQKVTVKLGKATLKANRDYTVTYKGNVNAGTAKVVIKGKGNYSKSVTKTFKIAKRDFSKAKITGVYNQLYTGAAITPSPTVKWGKTTLELGKDYTLSYKNNKNLGTATIVAKGKGNYSGVTKTASFKIYQINATSFDVGSISTQSWTGSSIQPSPIIVCQGVTLVRDRDYTVSYSNNVYGGWATMTITGKGSYTGSKTVSFYIDGPTYVGRTVYITNTGAKYHTDGCRYLYSRIAVDLGEAQWRGYGPCAVCRP
ncbi:MAG: hypothetical protein J6S63_02155 [Atopobiaceae bacterium]|nr:hypothetical protein [Atopobiaceae bacterium]